MTEIIDTLPAHRNPRFYPVAVYLIFMLIIFVLFRGTLGWLLSHPMPLGILAFIGFVGFGFWIGFRPIKSGDSVFKPYAPSLFLFVVLLVLFWIIRAFAVGQGSNFLGAQSDQQLKRYGYIPQEAPWIPTIFTLGNNTYRVDVPLTRIWTEVRLPLNNGQKVRILKIEPINAAIPAWYQAGQSGKSNRNVQLRVGERGAQQRRNKYEDWQWIPYRLIWPQSNNFIDSCLCPDGTVFGCPLIKVGDEWHFRIPGPEGYDTELCEQKVNRFYFGIDLPFGQHIAAAGVYRITFAIL